MVPSKGHLHGVQDWRSQETGACFLSDAQQRGTVFRFTIAYAMKFMNEAALSDSRGSVQC